MVLVSLFGCPAILPIFYYFSYILLIIFVIIIIFFSYDTSCGVEHMSILNEIKIYEESLDPEFCEIILEKINSFNDSCTPTLEILDCG